MQQLPNGRVARSGKYKGFRSGLERDTAEILEGFDYEPLRYPYVVHRKYTPDFVKGNVFVECKGFFRVGDTQKYKAIRDCLKEENKELVFILSNPKTKVYKGSKFTMSQWCEKEGFRWYTLESADALVNS